MTHWDEVWRFETRHLAVIAEATPCQDDPADSFQFASDIAMVRNEEVAWFDARVRVVLIDENGDDGIELGSDYLGCCAYDHPLDMFRHHASMTKRLRQLRGRTDSKSKRERAGIRKCLANNIQMNPPVTYCEYGPSMVLEACRMARQRLAELKAIPLRATA